MIIVEGIDRVGKSTLVNLLTEKTGLPVLADKYMYEYSCMRSDSRVNMEKIQTIINVARDVSDNFILDRLHWSEYVYGLFDRGYENYEDIMLLENQLVDLGAKIILVTPTDIEESNRQHGEVLDKHSEVFNNLFINTKLKKFKCDYNTLSDAVDWVVEDEKHKLL